MNKKLFPFSLLLLMLLLQQLSPPRAHAQCQAVWVPDSNLRAYLRDSIFQVLNAQDSLLPCQAAQFSGIFDCGGRNISDLTGIEHFTSMRQLLCYNNQITALPTLPSTLELLECSSNQLTALPALPSSIQNLSCHNNQLTALPALPSDLRLLFCQNNNLSALPTLPNLIQFVNCENNQLTSLPTLPNSLQELNCGRNQLTSLPTLPASMSILKCHYNALSSIPVLPSLLFMLDCSSNQLVSLPTQVWHFLRELYCHNNLLTSLPSLPRGLRILDVGYNPLASLPPRLPDTLEVFRCDSSNISALPALPNFLKELSCRGNQIACLPYLPNSLEELAANYTPIRCIPNIPTNLNFVSDIGSTVCSSPCFNGQNIVMGKVYIDANGNGQYNVGESVSVHNIVFSQNRQTATDSAGNYALFLPTGSHSVNINVPKWTTLSTPVNPFSFNFPSNDSLILGADFGLVETPNITDVAAFITPIDLPRPGFSFCYRFGVENQGTIAASGIFVLEPDSQLNYTGQTQITFPSIAPGSSWFSTICMTVPVSVPLGTQLHSSVHAVPTLADADTSNNRELDRSIVVGSYDPNDKACSHESLTPAEVSAGKRLTYTIRFQNTGTAEAIFVAIEDTLDAAHLDISSLEVIAASHHYEMSLSGPGHLKFMFHNIMLPDSNTNEPASHGFIRYSIRPKSSLALGDQISNTAHIYFDFNAAIVTNTVLTEVAQPTGLSETALGSLSLHPNPASGSVVLRADALAGQALSINVLDLTGRVVYQTAEAPFSGQQALDISDLPTGCYIVQLQAISGQLSQKLIVVR